MACDNWFFACQLTCWFADAKLKPWDSSWFRRIIHVWGQRRVLILTYHAWLDIQLFLPKSKCMEIGVIMTAMQNRPIEYRICLEHCFLSLRYKLIPDFGLSWNFNAAAHYTGSTGQHSFRRSFAICSVMMQEIITRKLGDKQMNSSRHHNTACIIGDPLTWWPSEWSATGKHRMGEFTDHKRIFCFNCKLQGESEQRVQQWWCEWGKKRSTSRGWVTL